MNASSIHGEAVEIYADGPALARAAANRFVTLAREAVAARGVFTVALAGGSTPRNLYSVLAMDQDLRASAPWEEIHFFFGDERYVPPDDPQSNFGMVNQALFRHLPIPGAHVHRVHAEQPDVSKAALDYENAVAGVFRGMQLIVAGFPRFDLILLGLGPDGHVASLFPDSPALAENKRWVAANWVANLNAHRITMTLPVLNNAAELILFVSGCAKAAIVGEVLAQRAETSKYPVQLVRPVNGIKRWMLDAQAAGRIEK